MTMIANGTAEASQQHHDADDVIEGLAARSKRLPCRLFYDATGAQLFERICELDAYYPTRTEIALLREHLPAIARAVGPRARVIEPGSGAGTKTRMLLGALDAPTTYVPIDVSHEQLAENAASLRVEFPRLEVAPVCGDYNHRIELPRRPRGCERSVVFFPGSTIGNFEPEDAVAFLSRFRRAAGDRAMLVLGADANQDVPSLLRAYDDEEGVTAAFNLNALTHLNRSHGATFDVGAFAHRAVWDAARSRMEMHLVSQTRQVVVVAGRRFTFDRGEHVVSEHCYKHAPEALAEMLEDAGFRVKQSFFGPERRMGIWLAAAE